MLGYFQVIVLVAILAGTCEGAEAWDIEAYQHCSNISLGRSDLTGIAYGANDGLVWALSSRNETVIRAYDLNGAMRRYLRSREHANLKGISWLYGDTLALTLGAEQSIAFANVGRASSRLTLSYKPIIGDEKMTGILPDKIAYNSEARMLMVTDLENALPANATRRPSISLVMLNGVVRPTTDSKFDTVTEFTDLFYAATAKKLFVLSKSGRELLEISVDGTIASRLELGVHAKDPISFTFSEDGDKLIVLNADGHMHVFNKKDCPDMTELTESKQARLHQEQLARLGRKVLAAKPRDSQLNHPIINIAGERNDVLMDDIREQVAKKFNGQNPIYLHYNRLPIKRNNYLGVYSICEAQNLTTVAPNQEYSGLAFHDGRKTVWTAATSVNRILEYSINGDLERGISIGQTTAGSLQGPMEITPTVNGDNFAVMTVNKLVYKVELMHDYETKRMIPKLSHLDLKMPPMYNQTKLVGLTWDDEVGRFFLAQSQPPAVWSLSEKSEPVLLFGSEDLPIQDITALAHNRQSNTLMLASSGSHAVLETSITGEILGTMGISGPVSDGLVGMEVAGSGKVMFLLTKAGTMHIFSAVKC